MAGQREDRSSLRPRPVLIAQLGPEPGSASVLTHMPPPPTHVPVPLPLPSPQPSYLFLYNSSLRASRSLVKSLLCCKHRKARSGSGRQKVRLED